MQNCRCGRPWHDDAHVLQCSTGHTFFCDTCGSTHQHRRENSRRAYAAFTEIVCDGCGAMIAEEPVE